MRTWVSRHLALVAGVFALFSPLPLVPSAHAQQDMRECNLTVTGKIPLPDAGGLFYRRVGLIPEYATTATGPEWREAGLYGQGRTVRPAAHDSAGVAIAQSLTPINGNQIVMISIGMSNTFQEFGRFEARAETDPTVSSSVAIVNGAQGSQPADVWDTPDAATWDTLDDRLATNGFSPDQVQVAWIKHAVRSPFFPPLDFPAHPETLQVMLENIVKSLKIRYPNVALTYVSSRTRAYNSNQMAQSPEPASYEGGFAVQWMIERQLNGDSDLRFDGASPPAPWLSWGPYFWTDGTGAPELDPPSPFDARSDGAIWTCADVDRDGVHPSPPTPDLNDPNGEFKIGDQLMAFFLTDRTTTPWFLNSTTGGPAPLTLSANGSPVVSGGVVTGSAPFTVAMAATFGTTPAGHSWTYGDGTFSYFAGGNNTGTPHFDENAAPTKIFHVPGTYPVSLAARDASGNTTLQRFDVVVTGGGATDVPETAARPTVSLRAEPNPFHPSTLLRFDLPERAHVRLDIHDVTGRLVSRTDLGRMGAGEHSRLWDATDSRGRHLAAGAYFARIRAGRHTGTARLVLTR